MKKKKFEENYSKIVYDIISAIIGMIISGIWTVVVNLFWKANNGKTCLLASFFIVAIIKGILIKKICLRFEKCNEDIKEIRKKYRGNKYRKKLRACKETLKKDCRHLEKCMVAVVAVSLIIFFGIESGIVTKSLEMFQNLGGMERERELSEAGERAKNEKAVDDKEDANIGEEIERQPEEKEMMPEQGFREQRGQDYRFVLEDPDGSFDLPFEREKEVFFYGERPCPGDAKEILERVRQWNGQLGEGVDHTRVQDEEGNTYYTYTGEEDKFKEQVECASTSTYLDDWVGFAPRSSEMDRYIKGREALNEVEVDGESGCYELWWRLANDYQYYAQEYEAQTQNEEAVLYFYVNSIYCCMEAMKYSISVEEYNRTYHYMVMRYHDVFRQECLVSQQYKDMAYHIYSALEPEDVLGN